MITIELIPLKGIAIDGVGEILLGDHVNRLNSLLGDPSGIFDHQIFYGQYEVRFDVDTNHRIQFIEFIYGPFPELTVLSIYGVDPFEAGAENLIDILTRRNGSDIDDSEAPYCYCFRNISVGVWRDTIPENMDETGAPGDDLDEDLAKAKKFWTIGIGVEDYYN